MDKLVGGVLERRLPIEMTLGNAGEMTLAA